MGFISQKKVEQMFQCFNFKFDIQKLESQHLIPTRVRYRSGAVFQKGWKIEDIPKLGEQLGFFKKPDKCKVITVFTTKGGVLKSTLALNLARVSALHNVKTLVIGLDIQGDITNNLGVEFDFESDHQSLDEALANSEDIKGLSDYFNNQCELSEIIKTTDLENLFLIPETPELAALNESLSNINRREYWVNDKVISKLKSHFDLIIFDCSPNWNKLTTNALVASNLLVSPLECKINNFRNFKVFQHFIKEFKKDMMIDFQTVFIPTKYSNNKKLSNDIKNWYQKNLKDCLAVGIPESTISEEATALKFSIIEHMPANKVAKSIADVLKEISNRLTRDQHQVKLNELNNFEQIHL